MKASIGLMLSGGILLSILVNSINSERICFSCSSMKQDEKCQHAISCDKDEICFVQKYYTIGNETKYDVGCTFQELCQKDITGHILGKRDEHAHIVCQKCCNDSNVCNYDLSCQNTITVPGQKCLYCDNLDNPKVCNSTVTCGKEELCLHGSNTNVFGRRSYAGRHLTCERCCGGTELCNIDLKCGHQEQKGMNASCTSTTECSSNLICSTGRCECASNKYYWDNIACITNKSNGEVCTDKRQCQSTMQCKQNICSCPSTQYWNVTACLPRKRFNSTCTSNEECETFQCINSKCVCARISEYWSGSQCLRGIECADLAISKDGVYTIYPNGKNQPIHVFCIVRQHEKWTVIQKRENGSVDFYQAWNEYKHGFGSAYGEYWLGNDNIHLITTNGRHEISIYMEIKDGRHITANYTTFQVSDEQSLFVLTVTGYSGDAGQTCMDYADDSYKANDKPFTTKDRDNDNYNGNFTVEHKSAWWYSSKYFSDLNKAYSGHTGTMYWATWSGSISKSMMMIKRTY